MIWPNVIWSNILKLKLGEWSVCDWSSSVRTYGSWRPAHLLLDQSGQDRKEFTRTARNHMTLEPLLDGCKEHDITTPVGRLIRFWTCAACCRPSLLPVAAWAWVFPQSPSPAARSREFSSSCLFNSVKQTCSKLLRITVLSGPEEIRKNCIWTYGGRSSGSTNDS